MIAHLYKRNISGRVTLLPGTELMSVSIEEAFFLETFMARACFPNILQFPIRETLFPVSGFCFKMQIIPYATRASVHASTCKNFASTSKGAHASEHSPNFCEQFKQRQNSASTQIGWDHSVPLIFKCQ